MTSESPGFYTKHPVGFSVIIGVWTAIGVYVALGRSLMGAGVAYVVAFVGARPLLERSRRRGEARTSPRAAPKSAAVRARNLALGVLVVVVAVVVVVARV